MAENISGPGGGQKFVSAGEFQAGESASCIISGVTFGPTEVVYYKVNNPAVFEGDIVLGTVAELEQTQDPANQDSANQDDGRARGVIITGARFRWPNAQVPFPAGRVVGAESTRRLRRRQRLRAIPLATHLRGAPSR